MKLADNIEPPTTGGTLATHIEQPVTVQEVGGKDASVGFFVIGGVINITMILAYFVWAYFQWKKIDKRDNDRKKHSPGNLPRTKT